MNIEPDLNTEQVVGHYKRHIDKTYMGSHDLMKPDGSYATAVVEISAIHKRKIYNPGKKTHEIRLVAALKGKEKMLILNSTNLKSIEQISGTVMSDKWVGTSMSLYVTKVKVGRETVDAIRIQKP